MRGLAEVARDGLADGADVGQVAVRGLVGVVDGAEGLEGDESLGVEEAGGGSGRDVVVAVEVAGVDVAEGCLRVRESGLVEHGYVLERGVVGGVPRALGLPSLAVAFALGARRAPLGLTFPVEAHFSMMRSGHLFEVTRYGQD